MATLQEIKDSLSAEISGKVLDGLPVVRRSTLDTLASAVSFLQHSTEIALQNKFNTLTPLTATGDTLDGWGAFAGIVRLQPTQATGFAVFTGAVGTLVPAGTVVTRCDGVEYATDADFTFTAAGEAQIAVTATDTGSLPNVQAGAVLEVGTVAVGLANQAVSNGIGGGSGIEGDEAFRTRIINALRNRVRTGTVADYEFWARLYPGVTRVCVIPKGNGPGTVKIYIAMDDTYPDGLPLQTDVDAVQDMIFGINGLAPAEVCGEVCSPTIAEIDVVVGGVDAPTAATLAEIETQLDTIIFDSFDCVGSTVCRADLDIGIRAALPDTCFNLIAPAGNITLQPGEFPVLGDLSVF